MCQLTSISELGEKNSWLNNFFQLRVKVLRKAKRNMIFLKNKLVSSIKFKSENKNLKNPTLAKVNPGDLVRIKSKSEIKRTLDEREKYKGCLFIDEMYEYCGKSFKVLKVIDYFFDEAQQKMCKCRDIVILDGVVCSGRQRLYKVRCDRNCFFFWHLGWLEKVEK